MEIQLTKKQAIYVREANHRWNFAIGAVRSGKSHLAVQYTIPKCLKERRGLKGLNLILGVTKESIERNVLEPMRDIWGQDTVGQINSRNVALIFGERVYCLGAGKAGQVGPLRGSEVKFCYIDEAVDINQEVFELLKSRLSLPYSVCHAGANPSFPSHFIKQFIDSAGAGLDIYAQHYTIYDNPFLPPSYVSNLEAEYRGTVYFQRYILGRWAQAEGLIYPMYETAFAEPPQGVPVRDYCVSIDYGTQNPFAALLWERYGDVWYAVKGYYYSGRTTNRQKTDDEYGRDMDQFVEGIHVRTVDGLPGKIRTIVDPSAASFIALLKKRDWCKVIPADNDVSNGIRETATAMQRGAFKVSPTIKDWRTEVEGYVWDDKFDDKPVKENDHFMDSMRYFVKTMRICRPKTEFTPILRL